MMRTRSSRSGEGVQRVRRHAAQARSMSTKAAMAAMAATAGRPDTVSTDSCADRPTTAVTTGPVGINARDHARHGDGRCFYHRYQQQHRGSSTNGGVRPRSRSPPSQRPICRPHGGQPTLRSPNSVPVR